MKSSMIIKTRSKTLLNKKVKLYKAINEIYHLNIIL